MRRFSSVIVLAALFLWAGCDAIGNTSDETTDPEPTDPPAATYVVSGEVQNVTDRPVSGATVTLTRTSGSAGEAVALSRTSAADYETTADADGSYTFEAVEEGRYTATISYSGYHTTTFSLTVGSDESLGVETLVGPSNVSGVIVDSQTGEPVEGAIVSFNDDDDTSLEAADFVAETGSDGAYTIDGAATGTYVFVVRIDGYFDAVIRDVSFGEGDTDLGQGASSPDLGGAQLRIVLNWGASPSDLDSHLTGPDSSSRFHVYYSNGTAESANLDRDDTSSYGPETITIENFRDGIYRYSVHNYSDQSSSGARGIAESPARVEVYDESGQIASYSPPSASGGEGDTWRVFELNASGGSVSIDDNGGATFGYFDAANPGDAGTFARPGQKAPLTLEQRASF